MAEQNPGRALLRVSDRVKSLVTDDEVFGETLIAVLATLATMALLLDASQSNRGAGNDYCRKRAFFISSVLLSPVGGRRQEQVAGGLQSR